MASASAASTIRPANTRSLARAGPTSRASRWVPPPPGMMPSRISGWPKRAPSDATRKSHARASSQPPPRAKPLTAAMVGQGRSATALSARRKAPPMRPPGRLVEGERLLAAALGELGDVGAGREHLGPAGHHHRPGVRPPPRRAVSASRSSTHSALTLPCDSVRTSTPLSCRSTSTSGPAGVEAVSATSVTAATLPGGTERRSRRTASRVRSSARTTARPSRRGSPSGEPGRVRGNAAGEGEPRQDCEPVDVCGWSRRTTSATLRRGERRGAQRRGRPVSPSAATPKSHSTNLPSARHSTLAGATSPCTTPDECAAASVAYNSPHLIERCRPLPAHLQSDRYPLCVPDPFEPSLAARLACGSSQPDIETRNRQELHTRSRSVYRSVGHHRKCFGRITGHSETGARRQGQLPISGHNAVYKTARRCRTFAVSWHYASACFASKVFDPPYT